MPFSPARRLNPHPGLAVFNGPRQPRVRLTWYEAKAYAAWRGGRLPTEAQWERAPWPADDRKNSHGARVIHTES